MTARFSLGQTVATPGAIDALAESGQTPTEFLSRHISGDWGEVDYYPADYLVCAAERLEDRVMLSAVTWSGGATP